MKKSGVLLLFVILLTGLVYAENLNLKVTGNINNLTSDLILKTSSSAASSFDAYDMKVSSNPDTYSQFYSTDTGSSLAIDSWSTGSINRTINLTFHIDTSQTGTLNFSWPLVSGNYSANLTYYGADSTYTTPVNTINMMNVPNFTTSISGASDLFMQLTVATIFINTETSTPTTPTTTTTPAGGGGGGGSATKLPVLTLLKVVPENLNLPVTAGIPTKAKISLTNTESTAVEVYIQISSIEKYVTGEEKVLVNPGETKIVEFSILVDKPGIYTGKIKFQADGKEVVVPVALNVQSESSLFDITLDLDKKSIKPGNRITGQISLIQAGLQEKVDVTMNYLVKDFEGKTYSQNSETIIVYKEKSYQYEFPTNDLPPGEYIIGTEVIYSGGVAAASSQFSVQETGNLNYLFLAIFAFAVLVVLIVIAISYRRIIKRRTKKRK